MTDTVSSTPVADTTPYEIFLSGSDDFLIPVVFPDYQIEVVDEQSFDIWGVKVKRPQLKAPYLGHAGVILINGDTGVTRYYEYGRYQNYNSEIAGNVRKRGVPNASIVSGLITESSLLKVLHEVSLRAGQEGRISGVVLRGSFFSEADSWLKEKLAQNNSPDKLEYDLFTNNCMTFVIDLADYLGLDPAWKPPIVVPNSYMEQFQLSEIDLDYDYKTKTLTVSE
ncbi:hypothetical protein AB7D55_002343 [Vibrio mimicus]